MKAIKGFLFDLDGVIVDTAKFHFKAWQRLASELDIPFTEEQNEELKGVSRKESLEKILSWGNKSLSADEFDRMMALKNEWYLEFVREMKSDEALPGAVEFLEQSRRQGLRIGLGSASKNAVLILDLLGIKDYFETIVDGNKITKSKPDPQVFEIGAENLGLSAAECVVFEDSLAGLEAAKVGDFRRVGIGSEAVLQDAEIVIPNLAALQPAELINKLNHI